MKKLIASLLTLAMILTLAMTAALAEEPAEVTFHNGIAFGMNLNEVMEKSSLPNPDVENHKLRGPFDFSELEYEKITDDTGLTADLKYFFVDDSLVAFHVDFADGTAYETVRAQLIPAYGEAVPFDAAKIGNGRFVIDDDGDLEDCQEMVVTENLIIVLEKDHEGDVDVTFLNPAAAFLSI